MVFQTNRDKNSYSNLLYAIQIVVAVALLLSTLSRCSFAVPALLHGALAPRDCVSVATCAPAPNAFLKINEFYVLFTYPIVPHRDPSGTFIVGLDALAEIMGAHTRTDAESKTETLFLPSHSITFADGESTATVDGKPVALPVTALWDTPSGKMIVPLSPILAAFHIQSHWDETHKILALHGKAFFPVFVTDPDILGPIWMQEGSNLTYPERGYVIPTVLKWSAVKGHSDTHNLQLTVHNVIKKTISCDHLYINFVQADFGVAGYPHLQYSAGGTLHGWNEPRVHQPSLGSGDFRTATHEDVGTSGKSYSLYVLAWLLVTIK